MLRTRAVSYLSLLLLTLTPFSSAQIHSECTADYLLTITENYSDDGDCNGVLTQLAENTIATSCSQEMKDQIGDCLKQHIAKWRKFEIACEAKMEDAAVSTSSVDTPADEATSPESSLDSAVEPPAAETAPYQSANSPAESPVDGLDDGESDTPSGPTVRRKLRKMLTTEQVTERALHFRRRIRESSTDTCAEIVAEEGLSAFADLSKNAADSVSISSFSIIGSILLGMMLF